MMVDLCCLVMGRSRTQASARAEGSAQLQESSNKRRAAKRHDKRVRVRHQRDANLASLGQMAEHLMCSECRRRQLVVASVVETLTCCRCGNAASSGLRCTVGGCEGFKCDTCCLLEFQENIAFYSRLAPETQGLRVPVGIHG